jgi:ATP-dependent helicase/nuclease subunit B
MGKLQARAASHEVDLWIRDGGMVVTASERAARSLLEDYHRSRRGEGLTAWPAPNILSWSNFVRTEWESRNRAGRLALNLLQEQSLWAEIIARRGRSAGLLDGPRHRLASRAIEAHQLICDFAPHFLASRARLGWQHDAEEFSAWLEEFDAICGTAELVSTARLPLELLELLEAEEACPPILLAGFDRVLPTQQKVFAAWTHQSELRQAQLSPRASSIHFYEIADPADELAACAAWSMRQIAANPQARLLIVAQDVAQRRGEFERAFRQTASADREGPGAADLFEFSLGVPLGKLGLARSAIHLLRWLSGSIAEHEVDWLFSSGYATVDKDESHALTTFMRAIRRVGGQRTQWTLADFLRQTPGVELPQSWRARMAQAHRRLQEVANRLQTPLEWSEFVPQLLATAGWPGTRPLTSVEHQMMQRWQQAVESCASLGFSGRKLNWTAFSTNLDRIVGETIFAPESQAAPIQIAGPSESAGLTADAIWFLGADENNWPVRGATHPLLPLSVQRETGMPHASPKADWDLAHTLTRRLLSSAAEVQFSFARQAKGVDQRPSRLIAQAAGPPQEAPLELRLEPPPSSIATAFKDDSRIPFPSGDAAGGANILSSQSQCPFKAFATARLGAERWDPAEAGLTAAERGLLLHDVMRRVWAGPPDGIQSHAELAAKTDLASFVAGNVDRTMRERTPARARESMPPRYLDLESRRLTGLVTEWLRFEQTRLPFTIADTELKANPSIAGLNLRLRLDRVDRLIDGTLLVIDYKTGAVDIKVWDLPRPEDVQLPLYAGFALDQDLRMTFEEKLGGKVTQPAFTDPYAWLGGLAFANVRAGEMKFAGRVRSAKSTLQSSISASTNLVKKPLKPAEIDAWRLKIQALAEDFLAGRAAVDPRDDDTCKNCRLHVVCRIQEARDGKSLGAGAEASEGIDE